MQKNKNFTVSSIFFFLLLINSNTIYSQKSTAQDYFTHAQKCEQQGQKDNAIELYKKTLTINPEHFKAHFYLANNLFASGSYQEAANYFKKALSIRPSSAMTHFNFAVTLYSLEKTDEAIQELKKIITNFPNYFKPKKFLGDIFRKQSQLDKAFEQYQAIIDLDPNHFEAQTAIADLYLRQKKFETALAAYKKAVEIKPDNILSWFTIGCLYNTIGETDLAKQTFETLLDTHPEFIDARSQLANTLRFLGEFDEAIEQYEEILKHRPNNASVHYGYAESLLSTGNLKKGFEEFEWRWKRNNDIQNFSEKLWDGKESLDGKKVLIRAEYGLGDTIHFASFIKHIKSLGAIVIVEVHNALQKIFSLCPYVDKVITIKKSHTDFDFQIPVMSLPHKLDLTNEQDLDNGAYLQADENLVDYWKSELARDGNFKIGICWGTSPYFDSFRAPLSKKAMHLSDFEPLSQLPNVTLYSLQKSDASSHINDVTFEVRDFGPDFDKTNGRFMDTAALMKNLDLIVTVDTSVAHLAGALGVPVWVVLPSVSDWRWMQNRSDTPWYPTMKLFRQQEYGNWKTVFIKIKQEIEKLITKKIKHSDIVTAEISIGELVDKITILELKNKHIKNEKKLVNIQKELAILYETKNTKVAQCKELDELMQQLYEVNQRLWDIEDACRDKERVKEFDDEFIQITRSVYINNDQRCALKRKLNTILGSNLVEEKSYAAY